MCSVGGIKPVLSRKSHNMCLRIHEVVPEAISRLFKEQFVVSFIPERLVEHWTTRPSKTRKNMQNMLKFMKNDVVLENLE